MAVFLRAVLAAALLALSTVASLADDWVAVRLRGAVLQLVDGEWMRLQRGDLVPDSRVIRTLRTGNVEFQRGEEIVTLGAETQIQIYDEIRARPFTTVKQYFGTVTVEAEVQDVQHFAVQTRYLAAVVKGTRFTVTAGDEGASVDVERGAVFVQDKATKNNVTVTAGQSAAVDESSVRPVVTGKGVESGNKTNAGRSDDKPDKGKPDDKPAKPDNDDKTNNGKSDDDDKTNNGKSDDDDKSNNGKSDNGDNSGKGKPDDDDKPGKGKSDDGDDD